MTGLHRPTRPGRFAVSAPRRSGRPQDNHTGNQHMNRARDAAVPGLQFRLALRGLRALVGVMLVTAAGGCSDDAGGGIATGRSADGARARVQEALERGFDQILERADSMDEALRPLPLLTASEQAALRRYLNAQQLERARALGVHPSDSAELAAAREAGRLVPLEDSTGHWVVRELDYSVALVVPDVRELLTEIGERFHAGLDSLGVAPVRMEVSSVLRTADDQARLRRSNPNAAGGTSTHEFGTTLDVLYSSFAAPADLGDWYDLRDAEWLDAHLSRVAASFAETVAARRSRELQAVLGQVLIEMQREGKVMVTLERQQPVFHMTLARRY